MRRDRQELRRQLAALAATQSGHFTAKQGSIGASTVCPSGRSANTTIWYGGLCGPGGRR